MNIRRFSSRNIRQAMAMVRAEFGDDAVILKTRSVGDGVEIVAMADALPDALPSVPPRSAETASASASASAGDRRRRPAPATTSAPPPALPAEPMSTLSFQQYVRDRLAQREQALLDEAAVCAERIESTVTAPASPVTATTAAVRAPAATVTAPTVAVTAPAPAVTTTAPAAIGASAPAVAAEALMMPAAAGMPPGPARTAHPDVVLAELRKMRGLIRSQLFSLARWGTQSEGVAHGLMRRLRACGLSATLVRRLLAKIPAGADPDQAEAWARQMLARVIRLDRPGQSILEVGGFHALVGPTGVGKTTTVAKMAAQFALRHGADSIGLVTLDTYRIGAHDQLRTFGRLLGVPVRLAHDAAGLASFMSQNVSRKLVLVDTVGIGQRDERLNDLIDSMASASIRKLLVLNAGAQPETLEDVVIAYRAGQHDGVVVSKVDEAVKLGGVVDCLVRHRLPLVGVADGQRVPEDWQFPDPQALVARAFDVPASPVFDFDGFDLAPPPSLSSPGSSKHA